MSEAKQNIKAGKGKFFTLKDGETPCFKASIPLSQLKAIVAKAEAEPGEWSREWESNGRVDHDIELVFFPSQYEDRWGTHYGQMDKPWKKDSGNGGGDGYQRQGAPVEKPAAVVNAPTPEDDDLPF